MPTKLIRIVALLHRWITLYIAGAGAGTEGYVGAQEVTHWAKETATFPVHARSVLLWESQVSRAVVFRS